MGIGVDDLDPRGQLEIGSRDLTLALCGQIDGLRLIGLDAKHDLLQVQDEVDDVFDDPFHR